MRGCLSRALLLVALLAATPVAAAWPASFIAFPNAVSLTTSLLLAGSIHATSEDAIFGSPYADKLLFDAPVDITYCPDRNGAPQTSTACPAGETTTGAILYVRAGGLVANAPDGPATLTARASAAALGGPNVTLNLLPLGPALYTGGETAIDATTSALLIRPLGSGASLEIRGNEGFRTYNGTTYTLLVSNLTTARLEARGAFLASDTLDVTLARAGLREAENALRVEDLFETLRALQPPETADRRAAISGAFGPFQLVPALLDGAAAGRANLTLNDAPQDDFAFVRLEDGRFAHNGTHWTGSGNASYMVEGDAVTPGPGAKVDFPLLIPITLIFAAIAGRIMTPRESATKARRALTWTLRTLGLILLALTTAAALTPLLGFSPILDARELTDRSRIQLALLVATIITAAYATIGFPAESITRSLLAWRARPQALIVPTLVGIVAAIGFVLLATPVLLSLGARVVRL